MARFGMLKHPRWVSIAEQQHGNQDKSGRLGVKVPMEVYPSSRWRCKLEIWRSWNGFMAGKECLSRPPPKPRKKSPTNPWARGGLRRPSRRTEQGPVDEPAILWKYHPFSQIGSIDSPLLIADLLFCISIRCLCSCRR